LENLGANPDNHERPELYLCANKNYSLESMGGNLKGETWNPTKEKYERCGIVFKIDRETAYEIADFLLEQFPPEPPEISEEENEF
jgi:hypothetical protein